ncbi:phosphoribosylglycinamide formyltransferase [Flavobacterium sp. GT3R68]|uniref:phosphoribosylglycinamide formyltransferase n=1 Tax=Flavobacterium sp. GT3R68 TaxID=2594437 RepID=UPI000F8673C0|nr:phosphoribosylglycinamide formyltransferase [Flavobacterium sp. GT3R68]RTY95775.1 phosphoribosylglycinamide formyltransferase [Flavobacterium sp. GSN2]TRW93546.1 phosphoribosylglycinamide formyltransferase [Flavobacterium sp. GT3R68]
MKKIVLFASGSGTNAENIILHFNKTNSGTVAAVFSNNPDAKVLERAQKLNVPTVVFSKEQFSDGTILQKLIDLKPDLIVLAGFLLKLPHSLVEAFPDKIINIHPALLPKYGGKGMYGMHVHRAIIENKEVETGISIHFVNEHYDEGNIIFQKTVALNGKESPEEVAEKVHQLEQLHFPEVIAELLK